MDRLEGRDKGDFYYSVTQLVFDWLGQHDGIIFKLRKARE
jgi:hypothetical protein